MKLAKIFIIGTFVTLYLVVSLISTIHGHEVNEDEVAQLLHLDISKLHHGTVNEAAEFILNQKNILKDLL